MRRNLKLLVQIAYWFAVWMILFFSSQERMYGITTLGSILFASSVNLLIIVIIIYDRRLKTERTLRLRSTISKNGGNEL